MSKKIKIEIDMDPHSVMNQIKEALAEQGVSIGFIRESYSGCGLEEEYTLKVLSNPKT